MSTMPLISAIMPTRNRRHFVPQAVRYFLQQDYPKKELIVVDDGEDTIRDLLPIDPRIRYIALSSPLSIGMKRNIAVSLAQGELICHFDDDDYYGPERLSKQAEPILAHEANITGLTMEYLLHLATWTAWKCTPSLHKEAFAHDTHSGTLMYRKSLWGKETSYPSLSVGEDAQFLRLVLEHGAQLARIDNVGDFLYIRHGENVWQMLPGTHIDEDGWQSFQPEAVITPGVLQFYEQLSKNPSENAHFLSI